MQIFVRCICAILRIQTSVKTFKIAKGNYHNPMLVIVGEVSDSHVNSCRWVLVLRFAAAAPDYRWWCSRSAGHCTVPEPHESAWYRARSCAVRRHGWKCQFFVGHEIWQFHNSMAAIILSRKQQNIVRYLLVFTNTNACSRVPITWSLSRSTCVLPSRWIQSSTLHYLFQIHRIYPSLSPVGILAVSQPPFLSPFSCLVKYMRKTDWHKASSDLEFWSLRNLLHI
jgi:hypothetical protein